MILAIVSDRLIDALEIVESNCDVNAVGDNGNAKGCLQIWNVVVLDVNRVFRTSYVHDDAFDRATARDICQKYLSYWGGRYYLNHNITPDDQALARMWNGGPSGWSKDATLKYWNKVKAVLDGWKGTDDATNQHTQG